jgi:uridylate kinase
VVIKATKVDYVYDSDPVKNKDAIPYEDISYLDVLQKGIKVMDSTAISLCMDNQLPIIVFNLHEKGALKRLVNGENIGTLVH